MRFIITKNVGASEIIDKFINEVVEKEKTVVYITSVDTSEETIATILGIQQPPSMIIEVLKEKIPDLIARRQIANHGIIELTGLSLNKIYYINDDPKNPINNSKNFGKINSILEEAHVFRCMCIDAVKKELDLIHEDESNGINKLIEGF